MGQAVLFFRGLLLDRVASIDRGALFFSFVSRVGTPSCRGPSLRSHAGGDSDGGGGGGGRGDGGGDGYDGGVRK